jgi:SEC-C motif
MAKPGRNDPCHCGSGKKYKKCCQPKEEAAEREVIAKDQAVHAERAEARRLQQRAAKAEFLARIADVGEVDEELEELTAASNAASPSSKPASWKRPRPPLAISSSAFLTCTTAGIASAWCTRYAGRRNRLQTATARRSKLSAPSLKTTIQTLLTSSSSSSINSTPPRPPQTTKYYVTVTEGG